MAMQLKWSRILWLWAGALGLFLILAILPISNVGQALWALAVAVLVVTGWILAGRSASRQRQSMVLASDCALPADGYRQPVVAVCGDGLRSLFGTAPADQLALRVTEQGCYLRVPSLDRLPTIIDYVLANRSHWAGQLGVFYIVNPSEQTDSAQLAGAIQTFRHQVARIRRKGVALPILLGSYLPSPRTDSSWFTWEAEQQGLSVREGTGHLPMGQWQQNAADLHGCSTRLHTCVQIESLGNWLKKSVLPHLVSRDARDTPCPAIACAMTMTLGSVATSPRNLWSNWLHERTALEPFAPAQAVGSMPLPFPDPLLALLPRQADLTPALRSALHALWLFVLAAAIALCSSAWQNRLLLRQVSDDLRRYQAIPEPSTLEQPEHRLREQAVAVLRSDAAKLDRYYREGEPFSLGFGLYSAERIRPPILVALAAYRVPAAVKPELVKIPDPVRLDSLSLFASGSAELKPGSTKVLINALVDIKAQPGWLIVIAGHTDATGDPQRNLLLSRARAGAVRDWMQRMGDIPDSCFAVQGFGSDQPLSSNDTPEGRAANRRVDIRLVPESGACALPAQVLGGQPQPRQKPAAHLSL
ncbi:putative lipoprotein YiaD precursor [compost metagenome]